MCAALCVHMDVYGGVSVHVCMCVCARAHAMVRERLVYIFGCVRSAGSQCVCWFEHCSVGPMSDVEREAAP